MSAFPFVPDRSSLERLAREADVVDLVITPPGDWDSRQPLTPPGLVWSINSDTCLTGRLEAPDNIAYDEHGEEFVFRQPRDEWELAAIMRAARIECFDCYRFDGLDRWSFQAAQAWWENSHVIQGWLEHALTLERDGDVHDGLRAYRDYFRSGELGRDMTATLAYLSRR
jgi:hypothetical protein